ncbi:MAG: general secretion pathway protein GspE [Humidesulfovibrio sp.]|nr:general secretion pathway protein GspE [Humidesulfovibrio sp.]
MASSVNTVPVFREPYAALARQVGSAAVPSLEAALLRGNDEATALLVAGIGAPLILDALAKHHGLKAVAYDERLSIPPELVSQIDQAMLANGCWFPLGISAAGAVIIAVCDPADQETKAEATSHFAGREIIWNVALRRDIHWWVEDFLRRASGGQVGVERTSLAFWRNTLGQWRTKLACYRTDMARARTSLNILRWGLGLVTLANALLRSKRLDSHPGLYWAFITIGLAVAGASLWEYLQARRPGVAPPPVPTLVEVTAATMEFLEQYHYIDDGSPHCERQLKPTMLGRLGDLLCQHSTILDTSAGFRERIHLARERNVLAAQRTVCACYRTVAARARTGLALLRTGVTLSCLGIGLSQYFGLSPLSVFDGVLVLVGLLMIGEGAVWYWPVRREPAQTPRCIDWDTDED